MKLGPNSKLVLRITLSYIFPLIAEKKELMSTCFLETVQLWKGDINST
jgi:hypothetical protein